MIVRVTQDHIDRGRRMDPTHCPVAPAMDDEGFTDSHVYSYSLCGIYNGEMVEVWNPYPVLDFVQNFDDRKIVKPFSFEIETGVES